MPAGASANHESKDLAVPVSNTFSVLAEKDPEEAEVSFKSGFEATVEVAMKHLSPTTDSSTKTIVESVITAVVAAFMPVISSMQATIDELRAQSTRPQTAGTAIKRAVQVNRFRCHEIEQYSKRDNVIISGVPETSGENTTDIVVDLAAKAGVSINRNDVSTSHRLKNRRRNQPAAIVAKFVRRDTKTSLMRNKKNLRAQPDCRNIYFDDHLTGLRHKILMAVKKDPEIDSAWTMDGKIICIMKEGANRKIVINSPDDLTSKLDWTEEKLRLHELLTDF